jgi:hypothetical protein
MARFTFFFLFAVIILGTLGGCGDPLNRQEVTGTINLKGQPVEDGLINFEALDGQKTGDGAQIVKGKYRIPREKGLSPGRYKVFIIAGNGKSGEGNASPDSPNAGTPFARERIPPEYNKESNVIKEVKKGEANQFDFNIP